MAIYRLATNQAIKTVASVCVSSSHLHSESLVHSQTSIVGRPAVLKLACQCWLPLLRSCQAIHIFQSLSTCTSITSNIRPHYFQNKQIQNHKYRANETNLGSLSADPPLTMNLAL
jgi:hypothetical protein